MEYVADAHALLWHLCAPRRLGQAAREVFARADQGVNQILVPAPALAEILMVVEKGRLPGVTMPELLLHLEAIRFSDNYVLRPLQPETVLSSRVLTSIPDIFDRLIVAEALRQGVHLLSRDPVIRDSGLVEIIWK